MNTSNNTPDRSNDIVIIVGIFVCLAFIFFCIIRKSVDDSAANRAIMKNVELILQT